MTLTSIYDTAYITRLLIFILQEHSLNMRFKKILKITLKACG